MNKYQNQISVLTTALYTSMVNSLFIMMNTEQLRRLNGHRLQEQFNLALRFQQILENRNNRYLGQITLNGQR